MGLFFFSSQIFFFGPTTFSPIFFYIIQKKKMDPILIGVMTSLVASAWGNVFNEFFSSTIVYALVVTVIFYLVYRLV